MSSRTSVRRTQLGGFSSMSAGGPLRTVQRAVIGTGGGLGGGGGGITSSTASYSYSSRGGGNSSMFGDFGGIYGSTEGGFQSSGVFGQGIGGRAAGGGFGGGASGMSGGFGGYSGGGGGYGFPPITSVNINKSLLAPLNLEVDPRIGELRTQEKEEIKTLNNKFAGFINKVRSLEQTNAVLRTKWELLQQQSSGGAGTGGRNDLTPVYQAFINNLKRTHDNLLNDKGRLENELQNMQGSVEDFKSKYEEEINLRTNAENEFVKLKKDVDAAFLDKVKLEATADSLRDELEFRKALCAQELQVVQSSVEDINAIIQMNNNRELDMKDMIAACKAQYDTLAQQNRAEIDNQFKQKLDDLTFQASRQGDDVKSTREEISNLNRMIKQIQSDIDNVKRQNGNLETAIASAEERGEIAVQDARAKLADMEAALQKAKQDLAHMLHQYQEVMNAKMCLDLEIAAYMKLLTGEERRMDGTDLPETKVLIQSSTSTVSSGVSGGGFAGGLGGGLGLGGGGGRGGGGLGGGMIGFSLASGRSDGGGAGRVSLSTGGGGTSVRQSSTRTVQATRY